MKNLKYIVSALDLMDKLSKELNIAYIDYDKYASIIVSLSDMLSDLDIIELGSFRLDIEDFILKLDIEYLKTNIAKYLLPEVSYLDIPKEYIDEREISDLNDIQLLKYLVVVLKTISWTQKGNLLLLKYSKNIWNTGWHNLAKQCRGKVVNWKDRTIVSYPFNKFYNLNEVEETKLERVNSLLVNANEVMVTDKKDGSAIILTNHNGEKIMNTNGSFENIQVVLATELFEKKYSKFFNNMPEGYTFVFELVHPENKIVLNYGDIEKLYLLAIRDLKTLKLLTYKELKDFADKWQLDITESFDFNTLDELIKTAETECKEIKEGWVIRLITETEDFIFKLKYAEYFKLARIKAIPSLKKLYILLQQDKLDDMMAAAEEDIVTEVEDKVKVIYDYVDKTKQAVEKEAKCLLEKYEISRGNIPKDKLLMVLNDLKGNVLSSYIIRYIKAEKNLEELFDKLPVSTVFEKIYFYINDIYGITEDKWNSCEKQVCYG